MADVQEQLQAALAGKAQMESLLAKLRTVSKQAFTEFNDLKQKYTDLKEENDDLKEQISASATNAAQVNDLVAQISKLSVENDSLKQQLKTNAKVTAQIEAFQSHNNMLVAENNSLKQQVSPLVNENQTLKAKLQHSDTMLMKISAVSKSALKEFHELKQLYADEVERRKDTEEYAFNLLQQAQEQQANQQSATQPSEALLQEIASLRGEITIMQTQIKNHQSTIERQNDDIKQLTREVEEGNKTLKDEAQKRMQLEQQLESARCAVEVHQRNFTMQRARTFSNSDIPSLNDNLQIETNLLSPPPMVVFNNIDDLLNELTQDLQTPIAGSGAINPEMMLMQREMDSLKARLERAEKRADEMERRALTAEGVPVPGEASNTIGGPPPPLPPPPPPPPPPPLPMLSGAGALKIDRKAKQDQSDGAAADDPKAKAHQEMIDAIKGGVKLKRTPKSGRDTLRRRPLSVYNKGAMADLTTMFTNLDGEEEKKQGGEDSVEQKIKRKSMAPKDIPAPSFAVNLKRNSVIPRPDLSQTTQSTAAVESTDAPKLKPAFPAAIAKFKPEANAQSTSAAPSDPFAKFGVSRRASKPPPANFQVTEPAPAPAPAFTKAPVKTPQKAAPQPAPQPPVEPLKTVTTSVSTTPSSSSPSSPSSIRPPVAAAATQPQQAVPIATNINTTTLSSSLSASPNVSTPTTPKEPSPTRVPATPTPTPVTGLRTEEERSRFASEIDQLFNDLESELGFRL